MELAQRLEQAGLTRRFPVEIEPLARHAAAFFDWPDPITEVHAASIASFTGALFRIQDTPRWALLYNPSLPPEQVRFTQAHEFGHYLMHRGGREGFTCYDTSEQPWSRDVVDLEGQADLMAALLLMPVTDFRRELRGRPRIDLDAISHCAHRYGVSLLTAIRAWLRFTDELAVLVVSVDGYMESARASEPAQLAGAFLHPQFAPAPQAPPPRSLAANAHVTEHRRGVEVPARVWFSGAPAGLMLREMKFSLPPPDDRVASVLLLPRGADVWPVLARPR